MVYLLPSLELRSEIRWNQRQSCARNVTRKGLARSHRTPLLPDELIRRPEALRIRIGCPDKFDVVSHYADCAEFGFRRRRDTIIAGEELLGLSVLAGLFVLKGGVELVLGETAECVCLEMKILRRGHVLRMCDKTDTHYSRRRHGDSNQCSLEFHFIVSREGDRTAMSYVLIPLPMPTLTMLGHLINSTRSLI